MQRNGTLPTYVFASVEPQMLGEVTKRLKTFSGLTWFAPVTGRYDLVVQLKGAEPTQIYELVNKIRRVNGIVSTQTLIPFEGFTNGKKVESKEPFGLVLLGVKEESAKVLQALKHMHQITEVYVVPGQFDIIATLNDRSYEEIVTQVQKIAEVEGVRTSETLFAFKPIWA